jgi:hypothetical protein
MGREMCHSLSHQRAVKDSPETHSCCKWWSKQEKHQNLLQHHDPGHHSDTNGGDVNPTTTNSNTGKLPGIYPADISWPTIQHRLQDSYRTARRFQYVHLFQACKYSYTGSIDRTRTNKSAMAHDKSQSNRFASQPVKAPELINSRSYNTNFTFTHTHTAAAAAVKTAQDIIPYISPAPLA